LQQKTPKIFPHLLTRYSQRYCTAPKNKNMRFRITWRGVLNYGAAISDLRAISL
jgi:hypothetical protein